MASQDQLPSQSVLNAEGRLELGATEPMAAYDAEELPTRVSSPTRDAIRRFRRNWAAIVSLTVVLVILVMAIFAPFMHTTDPTNANFLVINQAPSSAHWFGADTLGRDTYSRLVY